MMARVATVMRKELREFRRNKFIVGTIVVLPVIFLVLPVTNLLVMKADVATKVVRNVVGAANLWLFLIPSVLPTTLSAYAVVGERDQATLEPVLTTPVTREEYLLGKAFAVGVPTIAIAWGLFAVYAILIRAGAIDVVVHLVWTPGVLAAEIVFAPLLATFSIWVGLAFSVRSSDVRAAQQLAVLAMLPMVAVSALFTFGVVHPTLAIVGAAAVVLAALDVAGWRVVSAMFDRERLLTGRAGGDAARRGPGSDQVRRRARRFSS